MNASVVALVVTFSIVAVGSFVGFYAGARYKMDLEQWTVAGRGFAHCWCGPDGRRDLHHVFVSWSQRMGLRWWSDAVHSCVSYLGLCRLVLLPPRDVGGCAKCGLQTESDFFERRYGSKNLAAFVSLVAVIFMIPYLQLPAHRTRDHCRNREFRGHRPHDRHAPSPALVAAFVFTSGVRAVAWVSVLKDLLLLFAAISIGIAVP